MNPAKKKPRLELPTETLELDVPSLITIKSGDFQRQASHSYLQESSTGLIKAALHQLKEDGQLIIPDPGLDIQETNVRIHQTLLDLITGQDWKVSPGKDDWQLIQYLEYVLTPDHPMLFKVHQDLRPRNTERCFHYDQPSLFQRVKYVEQYHSQDDQALQVFENMFCLESCHDSKEIVLFLQWGDDLDVWNIDPEVHQKLPRLLWKVLHLWTTSVYSCHGKKSRQGLGRRELPGHFWTALARLSDDYIVPGVFADTVDMFEDVIVAGGALVAAQFDLPRQQLGPEFDVDVWICLNNKKWDLKHFQSWHAHLVQYWQRETQRRQHQVLFQKHGSAILNVILPHSQLRVQLILVQGSAQDVIIGFDQDYVQAFVSLQQSSESVCPMWLTPQCLDSWLTRQIRYSGGHASDEFRRRRLIKAREKGFDISLFDTLSKCTAMDESSYHDEKEEKHEKEDEHKHKQLPCLVSEEWRWRNYVPAPDAPVAQTFRILRSLYPGCQLYCCSDEIRSTDWLGVHPWPMPSLDPHTDPFEKSTIKDMNLNHSLLAQYEPSVCSAQQEEQYSWSLKKIQSQISRITFQISRRFGQYSMVNANAPLALKFAGVVMATMAPDGKGQSQPQTRERRCLVNLCGDTSKLEQVMECFLNHIGRATGHRVHNALQKNQFRGIRIRSVVEYHRGTYKKCSAEQLHGFVVVRGAFTSIVCCQQRVYPIFSAKFTVFPNIHVAAQVDPSVKQFASMLVVWNV